MVNMSLDPVTGGGTAERTYQISKYLSKAGIYVSLLTTDIGLTSERKASLDGVTIFSLPCLSKRFYIPKCTFSFLEHIVNEVDVVHLNNHWTIINALVYRTCKNLKKPYVVCPAGALPIYGRSGILKTIYNRIVGNRIIRDAAGHIAVSTNEIDQFGAYGVDHKKISIIPNGINPEDYFAVNGCGFRKKFGLGKSSIILFVGRLNHIKGPDLLLRAFCKIKNKMPNCKLVFVGPDGGMLDELKEVVTANNARDCVAFSGYLGGAEKSQAYHAADILVIPSRQEAMSIVVLEAGTTGTPVLLTDQCGFNEVSEIGGGRVVNATVNGIQKGLLKMLGNKNKLETMGEKLNKHVHENYLWESITKKHISLYQEILNKNN